MATFGKGPGTPLLDEFIKGLEGWDYEVTSDVDYAYNCIAYVAEDRERVWWPGGAPDAYWPEEAPAEETVGAFVKAYGLLGYHVCDDDSFDQNYEKIAIYVGDDGTPKHAAKQLDELYWTSKLGRWHDIKHPLHALEEEYGPAKLFMRRLKQGSGK